MYNLTLNRWTRGTITAKDVDLLVRTGWLTAQQGEAIKNTVR